jgi:hypothetical protein
MKSGDEPTDLKARTGLSTPPGRICCAREKRRADFVVRMCSRSISLMSPVMCPCPCDQM